MENAEAITEMAELLAAAVTRIETLEVEVADLKSKVDGTTVAAKSGRPGVFYKVLFVPKTGVQPQGKILAKVLSEIPPEETEDGMISHERALAAVESNLSRFKTVQTARRMLNYYVPFLKKMNALEVVE